MYWIGIIFEENLEKCVQFNTFFLVTCRVHNFDELASLSELVILNEFTDVQLAIKLVLRNGHFCSDELFSCNYELT